MNYIIEDGNLVRLGIETTLNIPEGVTRICTDVFTNNKDIKEIALPDSVSIISDGVFDGCVNLKKIIIKDKTKIKNKRFNHYNKIIIPKED